MAAEGSQQQRFKSEAQAQLEILNIEKEMRKLDREKIVAQADYLKGNVKLKQELEKILKQQDRELKMQRAMEKSMVRAADDFNNSFSPLARQAAQARYEDLKQKAADFKLQRDITAAKREALLDEAKILENIAKDQAAMFEAEQKAAQDRIEKSQKFLAKFGDIFKLQNKYYDGLKNTQVVSEKWWVTLAAVGAVVESLFMTFRNMDDALAKFRIEMGMLRPDAAQISKSIKEVAIDFTKVGVTVESAAEAAKILAEEFGGTMKISRDLIETTALLKSQLGVAENVSAGFLSHIAALSKSTAQAQRQMTYLTDQLSSAAGVPLNLVMQDVAKMSGAALALISRIPLEMVKTAVAARQMGTTLNKMADASRQILNFTDNVNAEMEASVLLGENVNLQLARELAYRRDIVGSAKAIVAEAKRLNFEKMDVFQMESFAAATGRSADELLKMIQAQRQLDEARNIDGLKDEVAEYERLQGLRESELKDVALQREMAVQNAANQARLVALQQQWNQLLMETMKVMYPVFDILLKISILAVKVYPAFASWLGIFISASTLLEKIALGTSAIAGPAEAVYNFFARIGMAVGGFVKGLSWAGRLMGFLSRFSFLGPFMKAIPVVGWIITGLQFLVKVVEHFQEYVGKDGFIIGGLKAIGMAAYDVLLKPFVDAFNWIMKWFGGHSPSEIGLAIVRGIVAVQSFIFDALTSPWRKAFAWILNKIPGMHSVAEKINAGMTGAMQDVGLLEKKVTVENKAAQVSATGPSTPTSTVVAQDTPTQQAQNNQDSATLAEILKAINVLNSNLLSGKVGVYLDGQLLSATLARQTAFKGGYGVNTVSVP